MVSLHVFIGLAYHDISGTDWGDADVLALTEINLIKTEEHFRISDETRRYFATLKRNESIRKRVIKPIPAYMPCFCQYCGETTTEWNQIDFDTRVGSCRDCSKIVHSDLIWEFLLLTKDLE